MEISFEHITPSTSISISLSLVQVNSTTLNQYEDIARFNKLCETGCINYGKKWSCPPHSPSYSVYSANYCNCIIGLLYCNLSQFGHVKTEYMKVKASNSILKSQADKLTKVLEDNLHGKALLSGSCRLCKPCSKKSSSESGCKNPLKLRYSLESLGLNVTKLSYDLFGHELLWYINKTAPAYSSVLFGVINGTIVDEENIRNLILDAFLRKSR